MTFGELVEGLGAKLGVEIEDAGGAFALEIDGETVILQDAGELLLVRAEVGEIPADGREGDSGVRDGGELPLPGHGRSHARRESGGRHAASPEIQLDGADRRGVGSRRDRQHGQHRRRLAQGSRRLPFQLLAARDFCAAHRL